MLTEIKEGYVKSEFHNGITTIEFFHPQSNSLPGEYWKNWPMLFMVQVMMITQK